MTSYLTLLATLAPGGLDFIGDAVLHGRRFVAAALVSEVCEDNCCGGHCSAPFRDQTNWSKIVGVDFGKKHPFIGKSGGLQVIVLGRAD